MVAGRVGSPLGGVEVEGPLGAGAGAGVFVGGGVVVGVVVVGVVVAVVAAASAWRTALASVERPWRSSSSWSCLIARSMSLQWTRTSEMVCRARRGRGEVGTGGSGWQGVERGEGGKGEGQGDDVQNGRGQRRHGWWARLALPVL